LILLDTNPGSPATVRNDQSPPSLVNCNRTQKKNDRLRCPRINDREFPLSILTPS
jgi:hypothetical protein